MGILLNRWLDERYSALWEAYGGSPFRFSDAASVLRDRFKDEESQVATALSELWRRGWLRMGLEPEDAGKKIYRLVHKRGFEWIVRAKVYWFFSA